MSPFKSFKINITKEKKAGASKIDLVAFKLFNNSNVRTLTSCYAQLAHTYWDMYANEHQKVLFLNKTVKNKLKKVTKSHKEKTNVVQSRPKARRTSSKKSSR